MKERRGDKKWGRREERGQRTEDRGQRTEERGEKRGWEMRWGKLFKGLTKGIFSLFPTGKTSSRASFCKKIQDRDEKSRGGDGREKETRRRGGRKCEWEQCWGACLKTKKMIVKNKNKAFRFAKREECVGSGLLPHSTDHQLKTSTESSSS